MTLRTAWRCWRLSVDSKHHRYSLSLSLSLLLSNDDNDDPSALVPPSFRQFKAASKKELEGYLNALGVPFSEGTLKAALLSALQEALKE